MTLKTLQTTEHREVNTLELEADLLQVRIAALCVFKQQLLQDEGLD